MQNKNENEELQSRREFFKKAAKAALPVIGAVVVASMPIEKASGQNCFCGWNCTGTCSGSCHYTCEEGCKNTCEGQCRGTCIYGNMY